MSKQEQENQQRIFEAISDLLTKALRPQFDQYAYQTWLMQSATMWADLWRRQFETWDRWNELWMSIIAKRANQNP